MAVLAIRITGDPVLHAPATAVTEFTAELRQLVADMFETMEQAPGVGLAAPQVGVGQRIFVFNWVDDDDRLWRGVAINPTLLITPTPIGEADEDDESEGCLSIPGERYPLRRSERAVLTALDLDGQLFEVDADGWLARIFQHEYDHLNGILYADRLDYPNAHAAAKAIKKAKWGVPGKSWMPGVDDLDA
jgi:peptide deformylase